MRCECDCGCACSAAYEGERCMLCANGEHMRDVDFEDHYDPDAEVKFSRENPRED